MTPGAIPGLLIGVTGTNGKTTTTTAIAHMLGALGRPNVMCTTVETRIGDRKVELQPLQDLCAAAADAGLETGVFEVTSYALSRGLALRTPFQIGVFTNLTRDHLDTHKTAERYLAAKATLFATLKPGRDGRPATAVLNVDDPASVLLAEILPAGTRLVTYGSGPAPGIAAGRQTGTSNGLGDGSNDGEHFWADGVEESASGTSFELCRTGAAERAPVRTRLLGTHMVANALAALAATSGLGFGLADLAAALETFPGVPGRMERVPGGPGPAVYVDYAHTPDALVRALQTARRHAGSGRLWLVFGCGGDRDAGKRPMMGQVAVARADRVILTADNPRREAPQKICREIVGDLAASDFEVILERPEAVRRAILSAGAEDVVLIAGRGHELVQEIAGREVPLSDMDVAVAAIALRGKDFRR